MAFEMAISAKKDLAAAD